MHPKALTGASNCGFSVGLGRFELPTFGPPDRRANQAAPQPAVERSLYRRGSLASPAGSGHVTSIQMPCTRRQLRYTTAAPANTQKCHGTFWEATGCPSASATLSPHFGHVPTTDTELGLR